jgi:hypothetical protein
VKGPKGGCVSLKCPELASVFAASGHVLTRTHSACLWRACGAETARNLGRPGWTGSGGTDAKSVPLEGVSFAPTGAKGRLLGNFRRAAQRAINADILDFR